MEQEEVTVVEKTEWDRLVEANSLIATTDIKGKEYAEVPQRVKAFRYLYPKGLIKTSLTLTGEVGSRNALFLTEVFDENGQLLSTGYAEEKEGSTFINKTSFIENAETSSVGRALGFMGLGIATSIASYEEVQTAKANQEQKKPTKGQLEDFEIGYPEEARKIIRDMYKVEKDYDLPQDVVKKFIEDRKDYIKQRKEENKSLALNVSEEPLEFY